MAVAVLGVTVALAAWQGRALATAAIRHALAQRGIAASALEVRRIGLFGLTLGPVRLGGAEGPAAEAVAAAWTPRSLLAGRLAHLRVDGLRARLVLGDSGLVIAGLPPGGSGGAALPVDALDVVDARIAIAAPAGEIEAALDARLAPSPHGLRGPARIDARATPAGGRAQRVVADLDAQIDADGERIVVTDASVRLPDLGVALTGADAAAFPARGALRLSGTLRHDVAAPAVAPLAVTLDAAREGDGVAFTGAARSLRRGITLSLRGRHGGGSGRLDLDAAPVRFDQALQPRDLAPILGDTVERVEGVASARLALSWGDALRSSLTVTLDGIGLASGVVALRDIDAALRFEPAWPPASAGTQRVRGTMTVAPLPEGPFDLRIRLRGQRLIVERASLGLAGGALLIEDATLAPGAAVDTALRVDGLDLGAALALAGIDGLSGSGTLDGRVPVHVAGGNLVISGGRLAARGAGVLRYAGDLPDSIAAAASDESLKLLRAALADFRYESLTLSLDRAASGEGALLLALKGNNPAVLDGHPFAINIRLEANFDRLAALLLAGYDAANALLRRAARP